MVGWLSGVVTRVALSSHLSHLISFSFSFSFRFVRHLFDFFVVLFLLFRLLARVATAPPSIKMIAIMAAALALYFTFLLQLPFL